MADFKQNRSPRQAALGKAQESTDSNSNWNNIPEELKALPQWVCANANKVPINPKTGRNASVIDSKTWGTYDEACAAAQQHQLSIGFVLTRESNIIIVDLDNPKNEDQEARHSLIFKEIVTYTELSLSGKGLHLISHGNIPQGVKRDQVEVYDTERYFILTGNVLPGRTTEVNDCSEIINKLVSEMSAGRAVTIEHDEEETRTDTDVYNQCLQSKNGDKFKLLWDGLWEATYSSQSEADFALINMLAFASHNNEQTKRLFRTSNLGKRDKAMREPYLDNMIGRIRAEQNPPVDLSQFKPPPVTTEPEPLPNGIPNVPELAATLLPDSLRNWITDIAERMQCPLDYPAVACMVTLSAVVGRQVTIRPQEQDDWTVVPNLWGAIIGPPGAMKSPPMKEVLKLIEALEEAARERHEHNLTTYEAKLKVAKQANKVADQKIKKALSEGDEQRAEEIAVQSKRQDPELPTRQRYLTQDTTVEKLGELLAGNPNGILVYRDELVGWLSSLEKQGHESARAFYLEAWDGNGRFTFDRIGRGTVEIEAATVSIIGGIQPGPLTAYLTKALKGGAGDDGLLQRFQLAVWPDLSNTWTPVDRKPNAEARQRASELFLRMSALHQVVATRDISSALPYLRFEPDAQALFKEWRQQLELRLRTGDETPAFEGVLAKQRSLLPSLALLIHLAEHLEGGPVSLTALQKAIGWVEYLEGHARRIYAIALDPETTAVRALAERIQAGDLGREFRERDVYKNHWKGLDRESTKKAVAWLIEANWLWEQIVKTGGRPTAIYHVSPKVL